MTIPGILILILIAIAVKGINPLQMALVVASVAWLHPTRVIPITSPLSQGAGLCGGGANVWYERARDHRTPKR